jgi:hypothetical protein
MTFVLEKCVDESVDCGEAEFGSVFNGDKPPCAEVMQFAEITRGSTNDDGRAPAGSLPPVTGWRFAGLGSRSNFRLFAFAQVQQRIA